MIVNLLESHLPITVEEPQEATEEVAGETAKTEAVSLISAGTIAARQSAGGEPAGTGITHTATDLQAAMAIITVDTGARTESRPGKTRSSWTSTRTKWRSSGIV